MPKSKGFSPVPTVFLSKFIKPAILTLALFFAAGLIVRPRLSDSGYGAPPYLVPGPSSAPYSDKYPDLSKWTRPKGPLKVGLQVGHWKNNELPDELARLRGNSGTSGLGVPEWQVNLAIAQHTKSLLEKEGIRVELLPATVPPGFWADAFVAIHADGSLDRTISGYKVAPPRHDVTNRASHLADTISRLYHQTTGLPADPNITINMTGYYAFSWRRFDYAIHPMTPAAILETGFLTNPTEAKMLINNPRLPAQALASALIEFLDSVPVTH